jgi:hypothetical protein
MKRNLILLILFTCIFFSVHSQIVNREFLSSRITGYKIEAKLNTTSKSVSSVMEAFRVNRSDDTVPDVRLHLYLKAVAYSGLAILIFLAALFLVADYSRSRQVANNNTSVFRALGFSFNFLISTFSLSYPLMILILSIQVFFGFLVFCIISLWRPGNDTGVLLMFLVSQILFIIRIILKTWRYASVTSVMEELNKTRENISVES